MRFPLVSVSILALAISMANTTLHAQHAGDVILSVIDGTMTTSSFSASGTSASRVFGATFGDTGIARFTSNPGFDALAGTFMPSSRVGFTPTAGLRKFTGSTVEFVADERLEVKFLTLVTLIGSTATTGFDLAVPSSGGWHRHFNFRLLSAGAKLSPTGVYVAEFELYSTDGVTLPCAPFWIVFNDGASTADHQTAIAWVELNLANSNPPCASDLNSDGDVGAADLAIALSAWGSTDADITGDGVTDAADLSILLSAWGPCP